MSGELVAVMVLMNGSFCAHIFQKALSIQMEMDIAFIFKFENHVRNNPLQVENYCGAYGLSFYF